MLKKISPVYNSSVIIGGEWLVAENNSAGSTINMIPEFPMNESYRGHFHIINNADNTISVCDTSFADETQADTVSEAGTIKLRWHKVIRHTEELYYAMPRWKTVRVPALQNCSVNSSGWLILKMTRTDGQGTVSFNDDYLGSVNLNFRWQFSTTLPQDSKTQDFLIIGAVNLDANGDIYEIFQQQSGAGTLWIPMEKAPYESSSSIIISDSIISESKVSESKISESKVSESKVSESKVSESKISESKVSDSSDEYIPVEANLIFCQTETNSYGSFSEYTLLLTGTFLARADGSISSYNIIMQGQETNKDSYGETSSNLISCYLSLYLNTQRNCWDISLNYGSQIWWSYLSAASTPVYIFPDLNQYPLIPGGKIRVEQYVGDDISEIERIFEITFTPLV